MAQKAIGPNFANELAAAGLTGLPFSWGADGVFHFAPAMTDDQKVAVNTVYAAHDPAKPDPRAEFAKAQAAGLGIMSTSTPQLNATYGTMPQDLINLLGMQAAVAAGIFPGSYRDMAATSHAMTGPQLTAIAAAVLNYMKALDDALEAALAPGGSWVAPAPQVTIP